MTNLEFRFRYQFTPVIHSRATWADVAMFANPRSNAEESTVSSPTRAVSSNAPLPCVAGSNDVIGEIVRYDLFSPVRKYEPATCHALLVMVSAAVELRMSCAEAVYSARMPIGPA